MARTKFSELRKDVDGAARRQERLAAKRAETLEEIRLYELRHAEAVSQAELAGRLDVTQGAISKLEHSEDVRVSTLRQYLEALGARLELVAVFEDEDRRVPVHLGKDTAPPGRACHPVVTAKGTHNNPQATTATEPRPPKNGPDQALSSPDKTDAHMSVPDNRVAVRLITRRSQVQILPPPPIDVKAQVRDLGLRRSRLRVTGDVYRLGMERIR